MAFGKLWTIAFRDLGRNRRRTVFTMLAVALGLALLIALNGLIAGVAEDAVQNNIRLRTGHVQLRAKSYEEEKVSLNWEDLVADSQALAARAVALPEVQAAAPVLWATGVLNTADDSAGLQIFGIDVASDLYAPIRNTLVTGEFLAPDDRSGILIGKRLADSLGTETGKNVSLTVVNADGEPSEAIFTVRGLFSTGIPTYDDSAVFMPISKAQAFTGVGDHASAIVVLLHNQEDADAVAAKLETPGMESLTWRDLNRVFIETMNTGMKFYAVFDGIVMLVVAVIIANTLLMAVFERIREMGILAALGMKGRQLMQMFLFEATLLGLAGIAVGIALGCAIVAYMASTGIYIGDQVASSTDAIALGTTMYGRFVPSTIAGLSLATLIVTLLASLYPAWFVARLEPVDALHTL